ncbi:hypothetical protein [Shimazuella alba]|uniref:Uncharacterized protein n=1 Tax=Shimazuella alba TaxID=2690964 RepID=A0A6I4VPU1_9BACL|nr:hypothetical protein [Shimazuella alba]MXQ52391.1 hypothetical protein [Shimazuella alba]
MMAAVHSVIEELAEHPLLLEALLRGRRCLPRGLDGLSMAQECSLNQYP